jgi:hypothetical protein
MSDLSETFPQRVLEADGEACNYSDAEAWSPRYMKRRDAPEPMENMYLTDKHGALQ